MKIDGRCHCGHITYEAEVDPDKVVIDLSRAHVWDASSVAALDAVVARYAQRGKTVDLVGLNRSSAELHGRLTGELAGH